MKRIALIVASFVFAGCTGRAPEWSYSGADGPAHWGDLRPEWILAKTGRAQSPINITDPEITELDAFSIDYGPSALNIVNNGRAVQVNYDPGSTLELDGVRYELKQFHFHSPSEHTVDGEHADMEMHLVHADQDGNLLVVGVLLQVGVHNQAFTPTWFNLPEEPGPVRTIPDVTVDAATLLPATLASFRYEGSLTTPPCSEGVAWIVLQDVVELSPAQVQTFRLIYNHTNRPVQPLNGRVVRADEP